MAGSRRAYYPDGGTKDKRCIRRQRYWEGRVAAAPTAQKQFDEATAYFRAAAGRLPPDRRQAAVLHEAATYLYQKAWGLSEAQAR